VSRERGKTNGGSTTVLWILADQWLSASFGDIENPTSKKVDVYFKSFLQLTFVLMHNRMTYLLMVISLIVIQKVNL
jgi:hypothetical protein